MNGRYYVGEWLVEPEQNRLVRGSETAKLDPKAIQVLSFLADHPNEILTKEQIFGVIWDGAFVSDEVLTTAIWGLRKALGDDAKEPTYIQTLSRKGYRLIAPVEGATGEGTGRWEPSPYPGLSAFSQRDARFFFGREAEVEALWSKLQERSLLGLIGPSGAGKSSLLRAGLIPVAPEGWNVILCQPRAEAFDKLSAALGGWRSENGQALWVVDQFEELFTLHDEETQGRFAELLGRASESGIHVLLSMRDDFLIRCHAYPALEPVFKDLTPVLPLGGSAQRRALTEPARASGYRFEDEALVAEILAEVSREKGALPLLAFAASKLWEKRDREGRRLTREAYLAIGGVSGALAHHAEATLSNIGVGREPLVREIFRNLTTASGTRVPMDRENLLTVFPDQQEAARVLGDFIDARLLTSAEGEVEVIHESLLSAWPRLVRWQAEDAAGAILRDQLRQAARLWHERGRADDLLWTGTAFRDFANWRERYPGGLTATEEAFARAASQLAGRRRRRRRIAVGVLFAALIAVAAVFWSLWRKSSAEALRAEASKVLALGQLEAESNPTNAIAFAIKSLELSDTAEARRFALRVLSQAPVARVLMTDEAQQVAISPSGAWVAVGGNARTQLLHRNGGNAVRLPGEYFVNGFEFIGVSFLPREDRFVSLQNGELRFWSVPEGREVRPMRKFENDPSDPGPFVRGDGIFTFATVGKREVVQRWPVEEGEPRVIGSMDDVVGASVDLDAEGTKMAYAAGRHVGIRSLENWKLPPRLVEHGDDVLSVAFHPDGKFVAASDASGEIRIWPVSGTSEDPIRVLDAPGVFGTIRFSPKGRWLAAKRFVNGTLLVSLWDLKAPPDAMPVLLKNDRIFLQDIQFDSREEWVVTGENSWVAFWPLGASYPRVLEGHEGRVHSVKFTPDNSTLLSASSDGTLRDWPLLTDGRKESRVLLREEMAYPEIGLDAAGAHAVVPAIGGRVFVIPLAGGPVRRLEGFHERMGVVVAFSPDGRRVAGAPAGGGPVDGMVVRIWDLETGEVRVLGPVPGAGENWAGAINQIVFVDEDTVLAASPDQGLERFDLRDGSVKVLLERPMTGLAVSRDQRFGFGVDGSASGRVPFRFDLERDEIVDLPGYGTDWSVVALDPTDRLVATGDFDGIIRVASVSGGEPHLLFGHKGLVRTIAFSPDGRWLASGGDDRTIRLWPVPDVTKTPPHKRPHAEFLAMLQSWTNMRLVPDAQSATGWKIEAGPFPGWAKLPERWQ